MKGYNIKMGLQNQIKMGTHPIYYAKKEKRDVSPFKSEMLDGTGIFGEDLVLIRMKKK